MKNWHDSISVVGLGNVGEHLVKGFVGNGVDVSYIVTSHPEAGQFAGDRRISYLHSVEELPGNQLVIVCVPDQHIAHVLERIHPDCAVAYTAGSVALHSLPPRENLGVFYPLQTFSKGVDLNLFDVPFFIEANNGVFAETLFNLAWKLSRTVSYASSDDRKKLHLAAVWVNNFTNHMNHKAHAYLQAHNLEYTHLLPLLSETVRKLHVQTPFEAQTGPARRGDKAVIREHLEQLNGMDKDLYSLISDSILQTYFGDEQL